MAPWSARCLSEEACRFLSLATAGGRTTRRQSLSRRPHLPRDEAVANAHARPIAKTVGARDLLQLRTRGNGSFHGHFCCLRPGILLAVLAIVLKTNSDAKRLFPVFVVAAGSVRRAGRLEWCRFPRSRGGRPEVPEPRPVPVYRHTSCVIDRALGRSLRGPRRRLREIAARAGILDEGLSRSRRHGPARPRDRPSLRRLSRQVLAPDAAVEAVSQQRHPRGVVQAALDKPTVG